MYSGEPGEIVFAPLDFHNESDQPWPAGVILRSQYQKGSLAAEIMEEVEIPIDFPVLANQTCKLTIPLKIRDDFKTPHDLKYQSPFPVYLRFFYKNGEPIGNQIYFKCQIDQLQVKAE